MKSHDEDIALFTVLGRHYSDGEVGPGGILLGLLISPIFIALGILFIQNLFIGLWEELLIPHLAILIGLTGLILYLNYNASSIRASGQKKKSKSLNRMFKLKLISYIISMFIGYAVCSVLLDLEFIHDPIYYKINFNDAYFKSLGYFGLYLFLIYLEHLILLIVVPVIQFITVKLIGIGLKTKRRNSKRLG